MKTMFTKHYAVQLFVVLLLVGFTTACDTNIAGTSASAEQDLIDQASSPEFTTLSLAIEAAGLTEVLRSEGPFTILAPTNEAFNKLPESAIRTLLQPENQDKLAELLTFHVLSGRVYASDVIALASAKSSQNGGLLFSLEDGTVVVNNARVVATDIEASNGIIHVVDTVLLPDWFEQWITRANIGLDPLEDN